MTAPQRIFRVRTGCFTCRARKKKCDETKPRCHGCVRNELECRWPHSGNGVQKANSLQATLSKSQRRRESTGDLLNCIPADRSPHSSPDAPRSSGRASPQRASVVTNPVGSDGRSSPCSPVRPNTPPFASTPSHVSSDGGDEATEYENNNPTDRPGLLDLTSAPQEAGRIAPFDLGPSNFMSMFSGMVPRQLSFLPANGSTTSYELLSHYIGVTTISMANGSTLDNPFMTQLIPLAFSSDLVLQLILTQSAVHRASRCLKSTDTDRVASQYYHRSLRLFQETINSYIGNQGIEKALVLGVGALIMCFVETAKGDVNGSVFDHLMAAHPLLLPCLEPSGPIPKSLREFLIEYYVYTATLSMISIDARVSPQLFLCDKLDELARDLASSQYIGNLCGCWLELILLIPSIFDLGRRLMINEGVAGAGPTADDFALFASLRTQILSWAPNPLVSQDVVLAGTVYQQAMLIYLHTALHPLSQSSRPAEANNRSSSSGMQEAAIQQAASAAFLALSELSPTARINTSLCWPIAVIGSVVHDAGEQSFLHERLNHMFAAIGLGNIRQTSNLLQHMWSSAPEGVLVTDSGPWDICKVMNENQIWISFA